MLIIKVLSPVLSGAFCNRLGKESDPEILAHKPGLFMGDRLHSIPEV